MLEKSIYECKNWFITLRKLRMLDKGLLTKILGPTREGVKIGDMQNLNENIHDVCASPYIILLVSCGDILHKSGHRSPHC
jgi:hypothetical protein